MTKKTTIIASVSAAAILLASAWYFSQPHSYEDCVLQNIDKAGDQKSAYLIDHACMEKFPEQPKSFTYEEAFGVSKK